MTEKMVFIAGYDQAAWTASTADLRIDNGPLAVDTIVVSWDAAETALTAVTMANLLAGMNPFKVTHEAKKITEIRGDDLYALNVLWLENNPITIIGVGATSDVTRINAMIVPVSSKTGANCTCLATKATITNGGTERLSLGAILEVAGKDFHYEILTSSYTAPSTGTFLQAYDKTMDGELVGFMIFGTTIAAAATDTISADKIRIKVNGSVNKDTNWDLACALSHDGYHPLFANPATCAILDNYVWVPFKQDPPVKGDRVTIDINAGVADAMRIIEVVKVAN
jgi:hypothetical protein